MTTLRQQARSAAKAAAVSPYYSITLYAADAASDVWEPLLREVLEMADGSAPRNRKRLAEIKEKLE